MDVVLTEVGKRQLSQGKLVIEHASLTDKHTFYEHDIVSGSSDATSRIYFEANSLPSDTIVYETDDSGQLITYTSGDLSLQSGGTIFSGSSAVTGSMNNVAGFASMVTTLLSSSIDNFKFLQPIATTDEFDDDDFEISNKEIVFDFDDAWGSGPYAETESHILTPINTTNPYASTIGGTLPVFYDWRLSSHPNLKFLPPVNKSNPNDDLQFTYILDDDYNDSDSAYAVEGVHLLGIDYSNCNKHFQWEVSAPDTSVFYDIANTREVAINLMNTANVSQQETADGIRKVPDGRVVLGMYRPVLMLPDLNDQDTLDLTTNLVASSGAHPAGTFPFQNAYGPDHMIDEVGWKALWSPMAEQGFGGHKHYRTLLPCNGTMMADPDWLHINDMRDNGAMGQRAFDVMKNLTQKISCVENSSESNLLIQFFESNPSTGEMTKLDLVELPEVVESSMFSSSDYPANAKMFFAGKIFIDDIGTPHFINLFTVVMAKEFQLKESGFIE